MRTSESKPTGKFTRYGFAPFDKGIVRMFTRLPDFTHYELAVYCYVISFVQNQAQDNGRQGLAYPTKARMAVDLKIGKAKLNEVLERLIAYGLFATVSIENRKGGHALTMYKPLPLPDEDEFIRRYGGKVSKEVEGKRSEGAQSKSNAVNDLIDWL